MRVIPPILAAFTALAAVSAQAALVWVIEAARICLLVFGCVAAGWAVGFGMGYRRGVNDAIAHDIACADHRISAD
jgi:hypothetical protein